MIRSPQSFRRFVRILSTATMLLILVLIAFESILPLVDSSSYMNQAGLQRTRSDILALAMLTLEYRPSVEHAQAISNLQVTLPIFEKEQNLLNSNNDSDEQLLLQQMRGDYLAIVTSAQTVVDDPNKPVDPVQVNIMMAHKDAYRSTMNLLVNVLVSHAESLTWRIFLIETGIGILLVGIIASFLAIYERRVGIYIHYEKEAGDSLFKS